MVPQPIANKIWAFGDKSQKLDVYEMDEKTMRIRITSEKVRDKVVRRGMWNIAGVPMVVSKWSPVEEDSTATLPLWVHLSNVPLSMYSWEGLSFITSAAGIPDHLHPETLACTNLETAKVFVKADLTKELPRRINFTIQGKETLIDFAYPWLPPRCVDCGKWGHYATFCKVNKKDTADQMKEVNTPKSMVQQTLEVTGSDGKENKKLEDKEKTNKKEDEKESKEDMEGDQRKEWETVSEVRRSPKPRELQFGQVTIVTPSRYAALRNSDEKGTEIVVEEVEEEEEEGEVRNEEADDIIQSIAEESVEEKSKENKKGRSRQILPRLSKTNHKVVLEATDQNKDMKRGSRKNN